MIKDIEEKSKTKFSIEVEFSFSFKRNGILYRRHLQSANKRAILKRVSITRTNVFERRTYKDGRRKHRRAML